MNGNINYLDKFNFGGQDSGQGTTFVFENSQGIDVNIGKVECSGLASCANMQFVLGLDVFVDQFICVPGACDNCVLKQTINGVGLHCAL